MVEILEGALRGQSAIFVRLYCAIGIPEIEELCSIDLRNMASAYENPLYISNKTYWFYCMTILG